MNEGLYTRYEHAGVIVEIVQDTEGGEIADPQQNDNAGTIYSWARDFDGDKEIGAPDYELPCETCECTGEVQEAGRKTCTACGGEGYLTVDLARYMAEYYDAALTIPLYFSDYGSSGARIYESDSDANCALCFTQKEIDDEWSGHIDPYPVTRQSGEVVEYGGARKYAEARINELDMWLQGYVFGIVVRERDPEVEDPAEDDEGEVLESVWGFIGDPDEQDSYIIGEARYMAESAAQDVEHERQLAHEAACRDVVTV